MISLSAAIMTHPRRADGAQRICAAHPDLDAQVVMDPQPSGPPATLRTGRAAWESMAPGATHHLVIQDDVTLCPGFRQKAMQAIAARPNDPLVLFASWGSRSGQSLRLGALLGYSWVHNEDPYVATQAVILPAHLARGFVEASRRYPADMPDNWALEQFLSSRSIAPLVASPNLVDHDADGSMLGNDVFLGPRRSVTPWSEEEAATSGAYGGDVFTPLCIPLLDGAGAFASAYFPQANAGANRAMAALSFLVEAGLSRATIGDLFASDLARTPAAAPAESGLGYPVLAQSWLVAFLLGVVTSYHQGGTDSERLEVALRAPMAGRAIDSLAPGLLARLVPLDRLGPLSARLGPLCMAGLRTGFAAPRVHRALADLPGMIAFSAGRMALLQG